MNSLNYINWDTSPVLLSLGDFSIGWYGVFFASGFFFGFHIMRWVYMREAKSLASLDRIFIYMVLGAVLGARLGHCLFYDPIYYLANPLEIIKIWQGGLASHGGVVGMLIAMYVYEKQTPDISFFWLLDRMTLPITLGSFFIRCGNFFNSEILGIPTTVPWAIVFSRVDALPRHPAQLYEAVVYLLLFILLFFLYLKHREKLKPGFMMGLLMVIIFGSRFFIEFVKIPQESFEPILRLNMGQWLSIPVVMLGIYFMYFSKLKLSNEK
jgi:prolipoprotein diacylglyceryl transferase